MAYDMTVQGPPLANHTQQTITSRCLVSPVPQSLYPAPYLSRSVWLQHHLHPFCLVPEHDPTQVHSHTFYFIVLLFSCLAPWWYVHGEACIGRLHSLLGAIFPFVISGITRFRHHEHGLFNDSPGLYGTSFACCKKALNDTRPREFPFGGISRIPAFIQCVMLAIIVVFVCLYNDIHASVVRCAKAL